MTTCDKLLKSTKYDIYCSNVAIVCIIAGVAISMVAFFYPVDWDFDLDPNQSAQENEERRTRQTETQTIVYTMSLTGVVLVTIGGIISSFLLSKYILLEECVKTEEDGPTTPIVASSPPTSASGSRRAEPSGNKENKEIFSDGQKRKLVDSDYLQLQGASQQYGSTT